MGNVTHISNGKKCETYLDGNVFLFFFKWALFVCLPYISVIDTVIVFCKKKKKLIKIKLLALTWWNVKLQFCSDFFFFFLQLCRENLKIITW